MTAVVRNFGIVAAGRVEAIELSAGKLRATVLTLGATLQDLRYAGADWPLVIGSDHADDYQGSFAYAGAIVGPVANRISGASATIAGKLCQFEANEGGTTTLHSGATGVHALLWRIEDASADHVTLSLGLADGLGGFPGNRKVTATYRLTEPGDLELTLTATTDAPTAVNFAHHGYWNLDGSADTTAHRLRIAAEHVLPVDAKLIPTGEIAAVAGTGFDFRAGRLLNEAPPLDHSFCLADARRDLMEVAELRGRTGMRLRLATTEPGLQVYDGRHFDGERGLDGRRYGPKAGVALEAQGWPDAPNRPEFPQIDLRPGEIYRQFTRFRIDRVEAT